MKKLIILLLAAGLLSLSCVDTQKILKQADSLLAQKKYKSAYDFLDKADPQNKYPDLVILKIKILIDGGQYTHETKTISLVDYLPGQNAYDIQWDKIKDVPYTIRPEEILSKQIEKHSENGELYQVLGEYYAWLARYDYVYDNNAMQAHFKMAVEKLTAAQSRQPLDGDGLYALGMAYSMTQELLKSIDCFNQAVTLGNKKPEVYFSLAGSQSAAGEDVQAIENGKKAFELYPDNHDKEAAALNIATCYESLRDYDNAEKFLISARQTLPQSDALTSWLLYAYVQDGKVKDAEALFEDEIVKNPLSLGNLQNLMSGFGEYPNRNDFLPFLKHLRKKYAKKNDVLAGLYFCEGFCDLMDKKLKAGNAAMKKSKSCAEKVKPLPQEFLDYFKPVDPKLFEKEQALIKQYYQAK